MAGPAGASNGPSQDAGVVLAVAGRAVSRAICEDRWHVRDAGGGDADMRGLKAGE